MVGGKANKRREESGPSDGSLPEIVLLRRHIRYVQPFPTEIRDHMGAIAGCRDYNASLGVK